MRERRETGKEGDRKEGIHEKRDSLKEKFGIQKRRNAGKEGFRKKRSFCTCEYLREIETICHNTVQYLSLLIKCPDESWKNGGKKCCDTVSLISSNEESHGQEKERENLPGFEKIVKTMLRKNVLF